MVRGWILVYLQRRTFGEFSEGKAMAVFTLRKYRLGWYVENGLWKHKMEAQGPV